MLGDALAQPLGVAWRLQQVDRLLQGPVLIGGDQERRPLLRHDLHRDLVGVDLLDEREEALASLAGGDRHGHLLISYKKSYHRRRRRSPRAAGWRGSSGRPWDQSWCEVVGPGAIDACGSHRGARETAGQHWCIPG